jgi:predicted HAD superfamily Cof-like phosphohydrolase
MTNSEKVREFMVAFDQRQDENFFDTRPEIRRHMDMRFRLIDEGVEELRNCLMAFLCTEAIENDHLKEAGREALFIEVIDALTDILYVTYGFFHAYGIDPEKAFALVHASNMSKLDEHGNPIYREDGKVLKSELYQPPNFIPMLQEYLMSVGHAKKAA